MKINLVINNPAASLKGYANVSPILNTHGFNTGQVHNLDWMADDSSCEELIADDVLSRFTFGEANPILKNWIKKLKINGSIILRGVDFEEVCRALILEQLGIREAAELLWGTQKDANDVRVSSMSVLDVIAYFEQSGLQVTRKIFDGYYYSVTATRIN